MKKNFSINLFGTLYNIDEDAYDLLERYLTSMKSYFSRQEGGDEIADDIEHRVAELLWERKEQGMTAVSIEEVKAIIGKIGEASEIDGEAGDEGQADTDGGKEPFATLSVEAEMPLFDRLKEHVRSRRLYRNTKDGLLGGVCSGLADYFDINDVLFVRLGVLLLFALTRWMSHYHHEFVYIMPTLYVILWVLVPVAKTTEDRLRMQGKNVTPENLRQQVMDDAEEAATPATSSYSRVASGCLKALLILMGCLCALPLFLLFMLCFLMLCVVLALPLDSVQNFLGELDPSIPELMDVCPNMMAVGLACGIVAVGLVIYGIMRLFRGGKLGAGRVTALVLTWLIALAGVGFSAVFCGVRMDKKVREIEADARRQESCSRLKSIGWSASVINNMKPCLTEDRSGYAQMPRYAFDLRQHLQGKCMGAVFTKGLRLEAGKYVIESLTEREVDSNDLMTYEVHLNTHDVSADNPEEMDVKVAVVHPNRDGMRLKEQSWEWAKEQPIFAAGDSTGFATMCDDEDWYYHRSDTFEVRPSDDNAHLVISVKQAVGRVHIRAVKVTKVDVSSPQ